MIQVQISINLAASKLTIDILEREDATEDERAMARAIESFHLALLTEADVVTIDELIGPQHAEPQP